MKTEKADRLKKELLSVKPKPYLKNDFSEESANRHNTSLLEGNIKDINNLEIGNNNHEIDKINKEFYGNIMYPHPPAFFEIIEDKQLWLRFLSQDMGSWNKPVLPRSGTIWVAGCGTNQALITALRFPEMQVIGSDLSVQSLETCQKNATALGVKNLELRNESLNTVTYENQFDYILNTGVIHHNAEPKIPLGNISRALKDSGILELMVYNRYHRIMNTSFAKAVRLLLNSNEYNYENELECARKMLHSFDLNNKMGAFLSKYKKSSLAEFADDVIQPLEHSYTVFSLEQMLNEFNLRLELPAVDQFSKAKKSYNWNLKLADKDLQKQYLQRFDIERWQITNLLMEEESPLLWFYVRKKGHKRTTEADINNSFLKNKFRKTKVEKKIFHLSDSGVYEKDPRTYMHPGLPGDPLARKVYDVLDENNPIEVSIRRAGLPTDFVTTQHLRLNLATSGFPYVETNF